MRWVVKNIINESEESDLINYCGNSRRLIKNSQHKILSKILDVIRDYVDFDIKDESYFKIESRPAGHPWHKDTGSNDHMLWCQVGGTILLSGDHTGGEISYRNEDGTEEMIKDREKHDLYFHTSDVFHKIETSDGKRSAFLIFI